MGGSGGGSRYFTPCMHTSVAYVHGNPPSEQKNQVQIHVLQILTNEISSAEFPFIYATVNNTQRALWATLRVKPKPVAQTDPLFGRVDCVKKFIYYVSYTQVHKGKSTILIPFVKGPAGHESEAAFPREFPCIHGVKLSDPPHLHPMPEARRVRAAVLCLLAQGMGGKRGSRRAKVCVREN